MWSCEGNARLAKAGLWKALKDICVNVTFTTK